MKTKSASAVEHVVTQALERLATASGQKELRQATERSTAATEPFRRAREVSPTKLHRRFTV